MEPIECMSCGAMIVTDDTMYTIEIRRANEEAECIEKQLICEHCKDKVLGII